MLQQECLESGSDFSSCNVSDLYFVTVQFQSLTCWTAVVVTEVFCGFPLFFQENAGFVS